MTLTSPVLRADTPMPVTYCHRGVSGGRNVSPPLTWSTVPDAASYVITVIDHHPIAREWVHWVVVDVPTDVSALPEGASGALPAPARELVNSFGERGYGGPQPPPGSGPHPYEFTVYALDTPTVRIDEAPSAEVITRALSGHVLASASLTVTFAR